MWKTGVSAQVMLHFTTDTRRTTVRRDTDERAIEKTLYDVDDRVIRHILFRYDQAGRLIEEGELAFDDRLRDDLRNLYRYDVHGRCVEAEMYWDGFGGARKIMSYNEHGDLHQTSVDPLGGGLHFEEPGWTDRSFPRTRWTEYKYEYDTYGNWVTQTEQIRKSLHGPIVHTQVTRRTLNYWTL